MNTRFRTLGAVVATAAVLSGLVIAVATSRGGEADAAQGVASHDLASGAHGATDYSRPTSPQAADFHDAMRKLWEDHITWTRLFIVSAAADLPDTDATAGRLLQNQTDIGKAIAPFYGEAAGEQLTSLLEAHILIAADILASARAGDGPATDANIALWYANGEEVAGFLSAANPAAWPAAEMEAMMKEHLDLTLEEAVARLQGDYPADIAAYEKIHSAILEMADMLSAGIIDQFPRQFR